jgi:hypothetical protein
MRKIDKFFGCNAESTVRIRFSSMFPNIARAMMHLIAQFARPAGDGTWGLSYGHNGNDKQRLEAAMFGNRLRQPGTLSQSALAIPMSFSDAGNDAQASSCT